ncbi:MAG: hypothetical protein KKF33_08370 [Alphaproteobacteria bacterium]|nr:hypothetical protein [Alphaproteobacteria bacterium]
MPAPSAARTHNGHSVGFNLAAIAALIALAAIALAYAIDAAGRTAKSPAMPGDGETLVRTIGGKDLDIPVSWFRYAEQRVEGFAKQVDLQLALPLGTAGSLMPVEVTILPRSRVRPSARLLDGVYLHQFQTDQIEGPPGLVGKPLVIGEGLRGETVWYDPISPDPFVAKCIPAVADGLATRCLRTVNLGPGLAAVYAFSADALQNWRQFDPVMLATLARIGI